MYDKKPTDDRLRKQIKISKIFLSLFGFMSLIAMFIGYYKEDSIFLFVMLLFIIFAIEFDSHIYYDKIRLEIRDLKRRR